MKSIFLIPIFLILLFLSCTSNSEKIKPELNSHRIKEDSAFSAAKYVYIDGDSILHVKLECGQPYAGINLDELKNKYSVRRVLKKNITFKELEKCCAVCIQDERYETLKNMVDSISEQKIVDIAMESKIYIPSISQSKDTRGEVR